jgi:tetratricopeptide (TPR) repeat protein
MSIFFADWARRNLQHPRNRAALLASACVAFSATARAQDPEDYLFQTPPMTQTPPAEAPSTTPSAAPTTPAPTESGIETPGGVDTTLSDPSATGGAVEPEINADAQDALARAQQAMAMGDSTAALAAIDEAISLQPDYYGAFAFRAGVLRLMGNFEEAIRASSQAISIDPTAPDGYFNQALSYTELKQYDKAIATTDEWLKNSPNNPQAYAVNAAIYEQLKDWEKVLDNATKAIDAASATAPSMLGGLLMQRGIAWYHLGEYEVAKLDFEQAAVYGGIPAGESSRWRGFIFAVQGDYIRAIQLFDRALKANPGNAQAFRNRGMAFLNLAATQPRINNFAARQAVASFNGAIRLRPNDAQLYYRRGLAYNRLGALDMARSSFQTAVTLDPKLQAAADQLSGVQHDEVYWSHE